MGDLIYCPLAATQLGHSFVPLKRTKVYVSQGCVGSSGRLDNNVKS
jgi:hypothetical protein